MPFKKATKYDSFLRLALAGPAGAGKTYTALTLAAYLADAEGKPVALVDTEHGSASKYADLFRFDTQVLTTFAPQHFIDAIHEAEAAGYGVLVIDSLSHAWNGSGGLLDLVESIARRKYGGNTFAAWKDATPLHTALIDTMLASKLHLIATMRSKQEYMVEKDEKSGKSTPRKVGLAPVQRDGMEYEFDVFAELDIDHILVVQKSRCPALADAVIARPDGQVAKVLLTWLRGAGPAPEPAPASSPATEAEDITRTRRLIQQLVGENAALFKKVCAHYQVQNLERLNAQQMTDLLTRLQRKQGGGQ